VPERSGLPWTAREEELWYEVLVRCIYGGMPHDVVRERVAVLSPYGKQFADRLHERWRGAAEAVRDAAISGSPQPREGSSAGARSSRRTH
jgi:hypothetical protein